MDICLYGNFEILEKFLGQIQEGKVTRDDLINGFKQSFKNQEYKLTVLLH